MNLYTINERVKSMPKNKQKRFYIAYPGSRWSFDGERLLCWFATRRDALVRERKSYSDKLLVTGLTGIKEFLTNNHSEGEALVEQLVDLINSTPSLAPSVAFYRHRNQYGYCPTSDLQLRIHFLMLLYTCVELYVLSEQYDLLESYEKENIQWFCKRWNMTLRPAERQRQLMDIVKHYSQKLYRQQKAAITYANLEYTIYYESCYTALCFRLLELLSDKIRYGKQKAVCHCAGCGKEFTWKNNKKKYCNNCSSGKARQARYEKKKKQEKQ